MDQRYSLSIKNFAPQTPEEHNANLVEIERWGNTLPLDVLGQWVDYTPVVKYGATAATIANASRYSRIGRTVHVAIAYRLANLNAGTGTLTITLPFIPYAPADPPSVYLKPLGIGFVFDISGPTIYEAYARIDTPASATFVLQQLSGGASNVYTEISPFTVLGGVANTGDEFWINLTYEAQTAI